MTHAPFGGGVGQARRELLRETRTKIAVGNRLNQAFERFRYLVGRAKIPGNLLVEQDDHLLLGKAGVFVRLRLRIIEVIVRLEIVRFGRSWLLGFFGRLHVFSSLPRSLFLR